VRRAYDPVLVSFERTPDRIFVWVVNDSPQPVSGRLSVKRMRFDGTVRGEMHCDVEIAPGEAGRCLDLTDFGPITLRHEFFWASCAGREVTYLMIGERNLTLPKASLKARHLGDKLEVVTDVFARQVTLEIEGGPAAVFDDNYFDLAPGQSRAIGIGHGGGRREATVRALNAEAVKVPL
jgi:beta-mannosidase